ncbi:MAG TPA: (Fe-S)-binding protein [Candidatus Deferrimicrobium sp.]|nr:(Fe-S)-binding protein [Candidatus Deferrimicrobium sp.]
MDPQPEINLDIDYKKYKPIKERFLCPTKEVDIDHFIEPDLACFLDIFQKLFRPNQKTFLEVFNCVHCNACKTSNSRYFLKRNLHQAGLGSRSTDIMLKSYEKYGTPFNQSEYRLKVPQEIPKDSDTLLYMGCLSTIKVPDFTLNGIKYLLSKNIHFTVLEQEFCCGIPLVDSGETEMLQTLMEKNTEIFNAGYKKIICVCPACFDLFNNFYTGIKPKVHYIAEFLEPLKNKRTESISIQHLCQLMYRGFENFIPRIEKILRESGFQIMENEKHWCCGGGMGIMHIEKTIEKIARIRVNDFHGDLLTTYCPSCYHVLKLFSRKEKISPKLADIFKLLIE